MNELQSIFMVKVKPVNFGEIKIRTMPRQRSTFVDFLNKTLIQAHCQSKTDLLAA